VTGSQTGIAVAAVLALVWIAFGFVPFLLVAVAMVIGALVGRAVDGRLSLAPLVDAFRGRRTSS
jgi:chromate transport protein ChrA